MHPSTPQVGTTCLHRHSWYVSLWLLLLALRAACLIWRFRVFETQLWQYLKPDIYTPLNTPVRFSIGFMLELAPQSSALSCAPPMSSCLRSLWIDLCHSETDLVVGAPPIRPVFLHASQKAIYVVHSHGPNSFRWMILASFLRQRF